MFGIRKLKKQVKHLLYEKEVQFNRNKLLNEKIEKLDFQLKHKPKFYIGDFIDENKKVCDIEVKQYKTIFFYEYTILNIITQEIEKFEL